MTAAAGAYLSTAAISHVYANPTCNAEVDLQGTVTRNEASVTNYSQNSDCTYDATLAVYDSPQEPDTYGWIEAQKLIGSKTVSVKSGETVTLKVDGKGPSCWNQSDLIRGKDVWTPPVYRNAMDTDVYKVGTCETTPTPTCTPTPTTTPGPTATPTPENGNTPTPTPTKVQGSLAPTGTTGLIYILILAGVASLITGMVLKRFSK